MNAQQRYNEKRKQKQAQDRDELDRLRSEVEALRFANNDSKNTIARLQRENSVLQADIATVRRNYDDLRAIAQRLEADPTTTNKLRSSVLELHDAQQRNRNLSESTVYVLCETEDMRQQLQTTRKRASTVESELSASLTTVSAAARGNARFLSLNTARFFSPCSRTTHATGAQRERCSLCRESSSDGSQRQHLEAIRRVQGEVLRAASPSCLVVVNCRRASCSATTCATAGGVDREDDPSREREGAGRTRCCVHHRRDGVARTRR